MIKGLLLTACLGVSFSVCAVDVYGVNRDQAKQIIKTYGKQIARLESDISKLSFKSKSGIKDNPKNDIRLKKQAIVDGLMKDYGFLFADLEMIYYPNYKKSFTSVEVVDKAHPERLRFVNLKSRKGEPGTQVLHKPDLIEDVLKYEQMAQELMYFDQLKLYTSCPVLHCTFGFDDPRLKPYLSQFNEGAVKERALILKTLKEDPDPNRRGAAIFLLGHFKNAKEVVSLLMPYVADKDEGVRNDAMRVIAETIYHGHLTIADISPFVDVLDSPYTTDRNKALYVLRNAVVTQDAKKQLLEKGGDKLVEIFRLKQPNNHDLAYELLKTISGKDFGSTNVAAWSRWVSSAKRQVG